jgi:nucleoporin p58/p45
MADSIELWLIISSGGGFQNTQRQSQFSTLNPPQQTQRSAFSGSIGQYTAAQQTVPGVRIDLNELRPTTRFNDLYEQVQQQIEQLDTFILNQITLAGECESLMPEIQNSIAYIPNDVELCSRKLEATEQSLQTDAGSIEAARELVRQDVEAAKLSFKAIQSCRLPGHFHAANLWNAPGANGPGGSNSEEDSSTSADLLSYFGKQADEMGQKLDIMKRNLGEVESYLSSLESQQAARIQSARLSHGRDGGVKSADEQVRELATVLREFEGGILGVAAKVGAAREGMIEVTQNESIGRRGRG